MNETQIVDQRVEAYVDEVARALGSLDPDDRAALLDDVREHATALLADQPGVDLAERLGSPDDFARELLESAGIPASSRAAGVSWRARFEQARASRFGRVLGRASRDFAPAWAALRGVAAMWLLGRLLNADLGEELALLLVAGGVAGWLLSARYAAMVRRGLAGRLVGFAVNTATVVVGLVLFGSWVGTFAPGSLDTSATVGPSLMQDGDIVTGIQAFGPDGKPAPVALFDQNGTPIDTGGMAMDNLTCPGDLTVVPVPYLSTSGQPLSNAYPARGVCINALNVVVSDAVPMTNGAPVQAWSTAGLPKAGQGIVVDANGAYAGLAAQVPDGTSTPGVPAPATPTPTPSTSRTPNLKTP